MTEPGDIYEDLTPSEEEWLRSVMEDKAACDAWIESHTTRLQMGYQTRIDYLDGKATHEELANSYKAIGRLGRQMELVHRAYDIATKTTKEPGPESNGSDA